MYLSVVELSFREKERERERQRKPERERDEVPAEVRLATEEGSSNIGEKCECR